VRTIDFCRTVSENDLIPTRRVKNLSRGQNKERESIFKKEGINFHIRHVGAISRLFLNHNISTFSEATHFVRELAYGRNRNKEDLKTVFQDSCGTCSSKHALLKRLAEENHVADLKLMMGIFRMNAVNTPKISATLQRHKLDYIPEAHNYQKYADLILDFTTVNSKPADCENDLLEEIEITADKISDFKVKYHQDYLRTWLHKQNFPKLTLDELWKIREQCIADLATR